MSKLSTREAERLVNIADTSNQSMVDCDPLVALARETRRSAERFSASVRRFGTEMPNNLDRFHDAMRAFRVRAEDLRAPV